MKKIINELKFKTSKQMRISLLIFSYLAGIFVFIFLAILLALSTYNYTYNPYLATTIFVLCWCGLATLIFIIANLFCSRIIIASRNIIKIVKRGKIVFEIDRQSIVKLKHRKSNTLMAIFRPFYWLFNIYDPLCDVLCICYYDSNGDIADNQKLFTGFKCLKDDEKLNGLKVHFECLSKSEIRKISSLIQIDTIEY